MLNKSRRYVWLDFETTWLDYTKDEPIQIWIVQLDEKWKIIDEFQSLIKPTKKTDELKHIVGFVTGLNIADLQNAPEINEILPEISKFFDERTILIWHNIKFDLDFLNKYFPSLKYGKSIDTFALAQTFVHYSPSYALEILMNHMQTEDEFNKIFLELNGGKEHADEDSHDAMYDTKNSLALFIYFVNYIYKLAEEYDNLSYFLRYEWSIRNDILENKWKFAMNKIDFPPLKKIMPWNISLKKDDDSIDLEKLENQKKYYVWNRDIRSVIQALVANKNVILTFSNIQKLDIAKSILNDMGIKNLGFIKEEQTINYEKFSEFLNKWTFDEEEILFVLKYVSHLFQGYGILDLNNVNDYRIYHFIKDVRNKIKYPIVLATHHGLFSVITNDDKVYQDYDICFFDVEWRYKSYNFFLSSPCDFYYTLNFVETLIYKIKTDLQISKDIKWKDNLESLQEFYNFFQIFIGVIFTETKKIFTNTDLTNIQHDPIVDHWDFHQTNLLRKQMPEQFKLIKKILEEDDWEVLSKQFKHIANVLDSVVNINKKMYWQSDFYFVYWEAQKFTDWKEFNEIFNNNRVFYFSNSNKQSPKLKEDLRKNKELKITNINDIPTIVWYLDEDIKQWWNKCFFVLSTRKEESKKIFEDCCGRGIDKRSLMLVENITWWVGKNIFKAKNSWNKIIIGWYSFLLYLYSSKINVDDLIVFNIKWGNEQLILNDVFRYYI